jgi:KDO2-lipid IV(A) lauroyltransferase
MSAPRGNVRNALETVLAVGALGPLLLLPPRLAMAGLAGLGDLLFFCLRGRRAHARRRVRQTLGLDEREADRVVRGAFRMLTTNVLEAGRVVRALKHRPVEDLVTIEGAEHMRDAIDAGHGVLLTTAHLGCWEAMAPILGEVFQPVWAVARPLDNPMLESLALKLRGQVLAGTVEKEGSALKMARLVRKGEVVGLLLDQNAGSSGVMLPFLGLPSKQHRAAGVLGARFGATVVPAYMLREPTGWRYRLVIEPPVVVPDGMKGEEAEREMILAVSRSLERRVREHPEQWNWLHDRWHSAEVTLFLERQRREEAESKPTPATAESTNGG